MPTAKACWAMKIPNAPATMRARWDEKRLIKLMRRLLQAVVNTARPIREAFVGWRTRAFVRSRRTLESGKNRHVADGLVRARARGSHCDKCQNRPIPIARTENGVERTCARRSLLGRSSGLELSIDRLPIPSKLGTVALDR